MAKTKMDKYDFVREIIRMTKSIRNIYQELYKFDVNGNRDSKEYQKYLEYLKMSKEAEKELYSECPNARECYKLLDSFFEEKDEHSSSIEIFTSDEEELIKRRIQAYLFSTIDTKQDLKNMLNNIYTLTGFLLPIDDISDKLSKSINVQENMLIDFKNIFLYYVREELKGNLMKRDIGLRIVYDLIFSDIYLESITLSNDFKLPEHIILNVDFIMESLGMDDEEFRDLKDKNIGDIVLRAITNLVSISDEDYCDKVLETRALLLVCIIKSGLIFLSDEAIDCIIEGFEEYKRTHFHSSVYPSFRTSECLVDTALESHKKSQNNHLKVIKGEE